MVAIEQWKAGGRLGEDYSPTEWDINVGGGEYSILIDFSRKDLKKMMELIPKEALVIPIALVKGKTWQGGGFIIGGKTYDLKFVKGEGSAKLFKGGD